MHLRNIYSSRRIEEFCRNDIRFMWGYSVNVPKK
ncbi:transposase [Bacteroides sp. NSJ-48]